MTTDTRMLADARGVTLVELMVALTLFSLVVATGFRFLTIQHRAAVIQEDAAETQQQLRAAMDFMMREIMAAGSGVPFDEPGIVLMEPGDIQFDSNVYNAAGRLIRRVDAGGREMDVRFDGEGDRFKEGKTISICSVLYCERHLLSADARGSNLSLAGGLIHEFPAGSSVQLINRVEYVLKPIEETETFKILRRVDKGVNPVAEGIKSMALEYFDREGEETDRPEAVSRIRLRLSARLPRNPDLSRFLESDVHLRN